MTKKVSITKRCEKCYYAIPDMNNLSFASGEPIMATCKFQEYKILLTQAACDEFKER